MNKARIMAALMLALLFTAATARSAEWSIDHRQTRDGFKSVVLTFTPGTIDTADFLVGANVNDSLIFHSPEFAVQVPWTVCAGHLFYTTQDTVSTIDTIGYLLQSKMNDKGDSTWWLQATCTKADEDLINTNPASADIKAYADADSVGLGDLFRVRLAIIAEEAQWRIEGITHFAAGGASDSSEVALNGVYRLYLMFVDKGNQ